MDKKSLRGIYLEKRKALTLNEKLILEESIVYHLVDNFSFSGKVFSCFLPILSKNEIDTWGVINKICVDGGKIGLTVWNMKTDTLTHRLYSENSKIELNSFGIPEPINGEMMPIDEFDYVIVPLLVADINGHRVGYGKGVYDRFLSSCSKNTKFIGLSLFDLVAPIDDINVLDIPLDACITPTKCIFFEK